MNLFRTTPRVVIIGAGIGGLSAAMRLAAQGFEVTVLDSAAQPGGKMRQVASGGAAIDAGPTVFTLRPVFEQLFADCGLDFASAVPVQPLPVLGRHLWPDGSALDLYTDVARSIEAVGAFAGREAARLYTRFTQDSAALFRTLDASFMQASRPTPFSLVRAAGVAAMLQAQPFATLWQALGRYFPDPRLRQLFGRYATYCGASPFRAPATLMLIAHVEQAGVWRIEGGMRKLAEAMRDAVIRLGGTCRFESRVARLETSHGQASGVVLANGERIAADFVVCNADREALARGLLGAAVTGAVPALPAKARSLSAITLTGLGRFEGFTPAHHNVLFSGDYAAEFNALGRGQVPEDATLYLCAQDRRDDGQDGPTGVERALLLINAPARGDAPGPALPESEQCSKLFQRTLARHGIRWETTAPPVMTRPAEFAALFPGTGGALYGMATHGAMAAFRRPTARSRIPGLYLAGGGVHPGPGVPMVALSGRMAAEALIQDASLMRRFPGTAIHGGIAMRSAMTGNSA